METTRFARTRTTKTVRVTGIKVTDTDDAIRQAACNGYGETFGVTDFGVYVGEIVGGVSLVVIHTD